MNEFYFVLYMPSCRCDPIAVKKYDEDCKKAFNLEENKIRVNLDTYGDGDREYLSYWILVNATSKEEALDKALVIMEESEIPNDVYKMMKTDVENYKKGVISHCGICKDKKPEDYSDFTDIPFDQELEMLRKSSVTCNNCLEGYIPSLSDGKCPACGDRYDDNKGLYGKYLILNPKTKEEVQEFCFVLKPETDPVAFWALKVYARLTKNEELKKDLKRTLEEIEYIFYSGK